jgi:NADH dehydrogenase [ubiquinone] 1 alpha subcomplex assembly factor 7
MQENTKRKPEGANPLHDDIAARIRARGTIPVAEYMGLAAEAYYAAQNPFGAKGDFTTAPEISQMFGEMIGAWLVDVWMQMGKPESVKLVELGPGRGTLAADIMRTISAWPDFRTAVTLHLVETSARLKQMQAQALAGHNVGWYDSFDEVPEGICFVVANEFFDALPVHQLRKTESGWQERHVGYDAEKDAFFFTTAPLAFEIEGLMPEDFTNAPAGSIFEISPAGLSIMEKVSARIARHGGAALVVDYGHTQPGLGDTLQAVAHHKYADPLEDPGGRDITAHVDFGTLATVASKYAAVSGPVSQGQFLITLGIEARAQKLCENATDAQRQDIMSALCRLVAPKEMGRLFKVIALTSKEEAIEPAGFNPAAGGGNEVPDDGP